MSKTFGTVQASVSRTIPTLYITGTPREEKLSTPTRSPIFKQNPAVILGEGRGGLGLQSGIYCPQLVLWVWPFALDFSKGKTQEYLFFCAGCVCANKTKSSFSLPLDRSVFEIQPCVMDYPHSSWIVSLLHFAAYNNMQFISLLPKVTCFFPHVILLLIAWSCTHWSYWKCSH